MLEKVCRISMIALIMAAMFVSGCNKKNNDLDRNALLTLAFVNSGSSSSSSSSSSTSSSSSGSASGTGLTGAQYLARPGIVSGMLMQAQVGLQMVSALQHIPSGSGFTPPSPPDNMSVDGPSGSISSSGEITAKKTVASPSNKRYDWDWNNTDWEWYGPDINGWYWLVFEGIYKYTYRYRTVIEEHKYEYIMTIEDNDSDAYTDYYREFHVEAVMDEDGLITGSCKTGEDGSGYSTIYDSSFDFYFTDWDPDTGAGTFQIKWGASSLSASYVPYHTAMQVFATDNKDGTLHKKITWYNDSGVETFSFEYDTFAYETVSMPASLFGY